MVLKKKYNKEEKFQEVWYDSSMIYYTKMVEDEFENKGDLTVVFKNGGTYLYEGVKFEDYVLLLAGGTSSSHGKAINSIIKGKYEYKKIENIDINELKEKYEKLLTEDIEENDELI